LRLKHNITFSELARSETSVLQKSRRIGHGGRWFSLLDLEVWALQGTHGR
jgi:hypothetical protein